MDRSNIFIRKKQISQAITKFVLPYIHLIPPHDCGCYIKLYYNGNILEDTIYISTDGHILNYSEKWKIDNTQYFNMYQFSIGNISKNQEITGN